MSDLQTTVSGTCWRCGLPGSIWLTRGPSTRSCYRCGLWDTLEVCDCIEGREDTPWPRRMLTSEELALRACPRCSTDSQHLHLQEPTVEATTCPPSDTMADDNMEVEILERLDKELGFVDPEEVDIPEDPPRPVPLPLGAAKAFLRPTPNIAAGCSTTPSPALGPARLPGTTPPREKVPSSTVESWGKTGVSKRYLETKARIRKGTQTQEQQTDRDEYLPPNTRTVGTMGPQVYVELRPGLCWRCGQGEHTRATCSRTPTLFCSRCGLLGTLSRDCPCGGAKKDPTPSPTGPGNKKLRTAPIPKKEPLPRKTAPGPKKEPLPRKTTQACPRCHYVAKTYNKKSR
ncbi:uncharacterized protein LOC123318486 isoform X1 [Coccinella septempunctata]|uniref:uncharacterized protein LOC123318281 n=1 Tax=Coccinella septempunctata TaxID=41139 RepID=UPI001D07430D|nr:uncharacterized protein LOC123318281 [Coccinella septempunctata]XP_044761061.1 uncharacterized protein LOC123318485 isoform X1 [Coccinella septempunctata]XP_044761064.1 uncharacterized protein LOC123318486 isoform X1 [Coccinella septempunctata]